MEEKRKEERGMRRKKHVSWRKHMNGRKRKRKTKDNKRKRKHEWGIKAKDEKERKPQ